MPRIRAVIDGADAPVAQSHSLGGLRRRTPFADPIEDSYKQKSRLTKLQRRQQEQGDSDSSSGDGTSSDDGEGTSSPSEESGTESGDQEALSPQQERLLESSPFSDFEVPTVPDLGALPMPPLNTRRSMRLDKIKRRSRRTLSARQAPEDSSSESDGDESSESEDETSTTSGNAPPSLPPPAVSPPPPPPPLPPPEIAAPPPPASDPAASRNPQPGTTASSDSSSSTTSTPRELNPPVSRTSADNSPSASRTNSAATITGTTSPTTTATLEQSTFIAAADPTGNPTISPTSVPSDASPLQQSGPAPESQTAIIAGVSVLGVAFLFTLIYLLFRYCVPLRTWYTTRLKKHRDEKAARLGTAPSPWKWPLQFIFGHDRPAPPRRQQQQQHTAGEYYSTKEVFGSDLESQTSVTYSAQSIPVADGFRGPQKPPEYKSYTTTSGSSWVANGWRAPLSHISQRLSSWPRRSGTARWFFGGGATASRWSDSDAGARTTYSEGQIVSMYGAGTAPPSAGGARRSSIAKSPLQRNQVQVSQVEVTPSSLTPPLPIYGPVDSPRTTKTTIVKPPRAGAAAGLGLTQTPVRPRASPRNSYLARSSVATTATSGTGLSMPPPPAASFGNFSHFSASTVDPATPRRFDIPDVPDLPATPAPPAPAPARRASSTRFPVRTSSVSSVATRSSRSSSRGGGARSRSATEGTTLTRGSESIIGIATEKPLPPVGMARGSGIQMI